MPRRPDYTEEQLLGFLQLFIEENRYTKVSALKLANYVNTKLAPEKKIDYRHFLRSEKFRECMEAHNRGIIPALGMSDDMAGVCFHPDPDINEIVNKCTSPAKTREVLKSFIAASRTLKTDNKRLLDMYTRLKNDHNELLERTKENEQLLSKARDLKEKNRLLRDELDDTKKQLRMIKSFIEKEVFNEAALRHLSDLHLLPVASGEDDMLKNIPESWAELFTDTTDMLSLMSGLSMAGKLSERKTGVSSISEEDEDAHGPEILEFQKLKDRLNDL